MNARGEIKARLFTRCGCSRELSTTYPPPPDIILPLTDFPPYYWCANGEVDCSPIETRRFKLHQFTNPGPRDSIADYMEIR